MTPIQALEQLTSDAREVKDMAAAISRVLGVDSTNATALRAMSALELAIGAARDLRRALDDENESGFDAESPRSVQLALAFNAARLEAGQLAVLAGAVERSAVRGL